jgi:sarcosine oxidase
MAYDAIVVGLGAMGSAAAYHLARRGQQVLGLDAFAPGHTRGSSHGETRIIRLSYFEHPDYVPLLRRSYALWRELQAETGAELLRLTGGIYLGPPNGELVAGALRSARQHALAHELLDAANVRHRFPQLALEDGHAALYEPEAGVLLPERCIVAHLDLAAGHGAELHHEEPVLRWDVSGGVEVTTATTTYRAQRLVLTPGAWVPALLGADVALPLRVERNVVFWLRPRADAALFEPDRFPIFIWETPGGHFYGLPHVERPGVKVALHHTGDYGDPDTLDRTTRRADEAPVRHFVQSCIPGLDGPTESSLVCLYTLTPDGHFVIDRHPAHERVVFASACSGHGFKFASVVGEILADLATTGVATPAADFLRLARLGAGSRSPGG